MLVSLRLKKLLVIIPLTIRCWNLIMKVVRIHYITIIRLTYFTLLLYSIRIALSRHFNFTLTFVKTKIIDHL